VIKKILKIIGGLLGVALLAGAVFVINTLYFRPFSIGVYYEKVFFEFALDSPELLSSLRILEQIGIESHNDDLDNASVEFAIEQQDKLDEDLAMLREYDRDGLDETMSYDILEWFLDAQARGRPWMWHNYPVNQLFGVQNGFPDFMANIHHVGDKGDAEDYVTRLSKVGVKFDQVLEGLHFREERGIIPPAFVVERVLDEMNDFVETDPKENILYTTLERKMGEVEDLSDEDRAELLAQAENQITDTVYPAYERLINYFVELQPQVTTNHGVWALPNGDEYYLYALQQQTTSNYTPEEIHQIGLKEVERIRGEMLDILHAEGYEGDSVAAIIGQLNDEPRFLYPDTDESRDQIIADYQTIIDEINAGLDDWFDIRPRGEVKVDRIPEFREDGAPAAYYRSASMDGSRPGTFYANLRDVHETKKFNMRTLAYHEAIPGHHFQTTIQQELEGVPTFRKILPFTAYSEGWALYTERLAWEAGFQDDPYDNLGRLQAEIFRAVRLVVDTGLHYKRWSRENAIAYMVEQTGVPESEVVTEIERYIVLPGQACAYKVGMLKILDLRQRAQEQLGEQFDIRQFHNVVLQNGDLPLDLLEREVDDWIAQART